MGKWYKIEFEDDECDKFEEPEFSEMMKLFHARVKITRSWLQDHDSDQYFIRWCFKFKDETDAMAFKLRWL